MKLKLSLSRLHLLPFAQSRKMLIKLGSKTPNLKKVGSGKWALQTKPAALFHQLSIISLPISLTNIGHLGHPGVVRPMQELWWVVVDVLDLDDKLGRRFQRLVGLPVHRLGGQRVLGLLLAVQGLGGVDVARLVVDDEDGSGSFPGQDVLDVAIARVDVRVELSKETEKDKESVRLEVSLNCCFGENNNNKKEKKRNEPAPQGKHWKTSQPAPCEASISQV